ncbi:MAG: SUMF1/EgtB/PvdO family nonheme iron enzyme [Clostridia bacterium]
MEENKKIQITRIGLIAIIAIVVIAIIIISIVLVTGKKKEETNQPVEENKVVENEQEQPIQEETIEIAKDPLPQIDINTIASENSTIDGKTPCYYNPVIPKGFKAVNQEQDETIDKTAKWGEQNSYLNGLVIEDEKQNQFVWIPVENMDLFHTTDWQKNVPKETLDKTYIEPIESEKAEYKQMYQKVRKYGGFYVGRFEVGDAEAQNARTEVKNSDNIAIRKGLQVYDYVPFEQTTINKREITGAKELAIKFGKTNQYEEITTSVMYGVQWDSMLRFLASNTYNVNDSLTWGNYPNATLEYKDIQGNTYIKQQGEARLILTGNSENTKAKNIYDVAGNVYEWTQETAGTNVRVVRGGSYMVTIGQLAATRYAYNAATANNTIGFRISFYIN